MSEHTTLLCIIFIRRVTFSICVGFLHVHKNNGPFASDTLTDIANVYGNFKSFLFLPADAVVLVKLSCFSFFWDGAKWSLIGNSLLSSFLPSRWVSRDLDSWVRVARVWSRICWSSTVSKDVQIFCNSLSIAFFFPTIAIMEKKEKNKHASVL